MTTKKILILGGGYAGLMAAIRLAGKTKRLKPQITLVNGLPYFVERLLLHEQAAGKALKQEPIESMLRGTGVRFVQGWVSGLNPTEQTVQVRTAAGEQTLPYDYLINALGSRVNRAAVPGVDRYAFSLDSVGDLTTMALGEKLKQAQPGWRVIVVGGGATGIEAAAEIKVRLPQSEVALVTRGDVGAFKGPEVQRHLQAALREQAIMLHEHQTVRQVDAEGVMLANGRLPADVVLWAGGFVASSLGREAGLQVNGRDQILVDPYLRTLSHPTIYGVGDAAWPVETPGAPVRMSLFTALLMGAHVADNIAALLKGRAMKPFSFAWYGQGIALGPDDAVGFGAYPLDQPGRFIVRGKTAVYLRRFFISYLGFVFTLERWLPGFFFWNGKQRYTQQRRLQEQQPQIRSSQ